MKQSIHVPDHGPALRSVAILGRALVNNHIVGRVPVSDRRGRGAAVDLVLERAPEDGSHFVFTKSGGHDVVV